MKPYPLLKLPALLKAKGQTEDDGRLYALAVAQTEFTITIVHATSDGTPQPSYGTFGDKLTGPIPTYLKQELYAIYDIVQEGMND